MSHITGEIGESPAIARCNTCLSPSPSLIRLQGRLYEANLYISHLSNERNLQNAKNLELQQRCDDYTATFTWIAADRTQLQCELQGFQTQLAAVKIECQHESKSHKKTEENLERERGTVSGLISIINTILLPRYTQTKLLIPENFNPGDLLKKSWDWERQAKQMTEDAQVKDTLIEGLQKKLTTSEEEKEELNRRLAEKRAEIFELQQRLAVL